MTSGPGQALGAEVWPPLLDGNIRPMEQAPIEDLASLIGSRVGLNAHDELAPAKAERFLEGLIGPEDEVARRASEGYGGATNAVAEADHARLEIVRRVAEKFGFKLVPVIEQTAGEF